MTRRPTKTLDPKPPPSILSPLTFKEMAHTFSKVCVLHDLVMQGPGSTEWPVVHMQVRGGGGQKEGRSCLNLPQCFTASSALYGKTIPKTSFLPGLPCCSRGWRLTRGRLVISSISIHPWMSLHPLTIACLERRRFPGIRQVRSLADWLTEQIKASMGRRLPYLLLPPFPVPCSHPQGPSSSPKTSLPASSCSMRV